MDLVEKSILYLLLFVDRDNCRKHLISIASDFIKSHQSLLGCCIIDIIEIKKYSKEVKKILEHPGK